MSDDRLRAGLGIPHGYLSVAFKWQSVEIVSSAIPSRSLRELVNIYGLTLAVASEDIVEAQGIPGEILVECLC